MAPDFRPRDIFSRSESKSILSLEEASRFYDGGRVIALQDITLTISRGDFVTVLGPSGGGKSTLLALMSGIERPNQGRVLFEEQEPKSSKDWAWLRSRRIGFVFQAFHLLPTLTAVENVEIPMFGVIRHNKARYRRAQYLLAKVGLATRENHRALDLSGGERQRVAIARSLANSPSLILADEPTGNLDTKTSLEIIELLASMNKTEGTTLVVATHNQAIASRANRIIHLEDGRIISDFRQEADE